MSFKNKLNKHYKIKVKDNYITIKSKDTGEENTYKLKDEYIHFGYGIDIKDLNKMQIEELIIGGLIDRVHLGELYMMYTGKSEEEVEALIANCDVASLRFIEELEEQCAIFSIKVKDEKTLEEYEVVDILENDETYVRVHELMNDLYAVERFVCFDIEEYKYIVYYFNRKPSIEDYELAEKVFEIRRLFKAGCKPFFKCVSCSGGYHWLQVYGDEPLNEKIKMLRDNRCTYCKEDDHRF